MGVYLWTENWSPGANTKLYLQFDGNYNDSMGNTMSLLGGTAPTYSTTTAGEKYANVSSCLIGTTISGLDINTWTTSLWLYKTSTTVDVIWYCGGSTSVVSNYGTGMLIKNKRINIFIYDGDIDTGVDVSLNAWHNIIFTANSGTTKIYVDGELETTISKTYSKKGEIFRLFRNPYVSANPYVGRIDELIFEQKVWTDAEISDYYNSTKANYGIS